MRAASPMLSRSLSSRCCCRVGVKSGALIPPPGRTSQLSYPRWPIIRRERTARRAGGGRATIAVGLMLVLAVVGIFAFATPFIAGFAAYTYAADTLGKLNFASHEATFQTSRIYDRNSNLLYEFVDPLA